MAAAMADAMGGHLGAAAVIEDPVDAEAPVPAEAAAALAVRSALAASNLGMLRTNHFLSWEQRKLWDVPTIFVRPIFQG